MRVMKQINNSKAQDQQRGFTLVEICIVIIISGLMLNAMVMLYSQYQKSKAITVTKANLSNVEKDIQYFYSAHGFYPCPARQDLPTGDVNYGRAQDCDALTDDVVIGTPPLYAPNPDYIPACATSTDDVVCPRKTRNEFYSVSTSYAANDGWNSRLTYAVTRNMAISKATFDPDNAIITLNNLDGSTISTAEPFLIISHGPDALGAFTKNGSARAECIGITANDIENCDGDAIFIGGDSRSTKQDAGYFNDYVFQKTSRGTSDSCNRDPDAGPLQVLVGVNDDGSANCAPDDAAICSGKGMGFDPNDIAADSDGCAHASGLLLGQCVTGWQGLDYAPHAIQAPAYWDNTNKTCDINPTGMFGGAGGWDNNSCREGCKCPAGYALQWTGECNSLENIGLNTGTWCSQTNHPTGSWTYGWAFMACRKL